MKKRLRRLSGDSGIAPVAPCTGRHQLAEVTEENLPPAPSARDIGLHRLDRDPAGSEMVGRPRHLCVPRVHGYGFCQAQVLCEPKQAAPRLISVPPCPTGLLVVGLGTGWNTEVNDEAYIGLVDAEALRCSDDARFY